MLNTISFDFDSTISNSRHRQPMIDRVNGTDWVEYGLRSQFDTDGPALPIARYLSAKNEPWIIVSGRAEAARSVSMEWLHARHLYPWAVYLCDSRHDTMPHGEWKALRFKEIQKESGFKIVMHFDDVSSVSAAVNADPELDFPVILVHEAGDLEDRIG